MASRAAAMQEARDGKGIEAPAAPAEATANTAQPAAPAAQPAAAPLGRKRPERK